jgi:hypothetical protein
MKAKSKTAKPKSRKSKADDAAQYERFREFAREVETDDNPKAFDHQFRKIVPPVHTKADLRGSKK